MPLPAILTSNVIASGASGLLSGLGSIFSSNKAAEAQRLANQTNLQIARETNRANLDIANRNNEFNREMYEKQNADAIEFWNMQNSYNDPSKEVSRLRAAGLNPAMAFGDGAQAGSIQTASAPTADTSGVQQAATVQPVQPVTNFAEAAGTAIQQAIGTYRSIEEARMASVDREFARANAMADLENKKADLDKKGKESRILDDTLNVLSKTFDSRVDQSLLQTDLARASIDHMNETIRDIQSQRDYREGILKLQQDMHEFEQDKFAKEYEALCKRIAIERQNAQTNAYNARTGRLDYELANRQYNYGKKQAFRDYLVNLKKMGMDQKNADRAARLARDQFEYSKLHPLTKLAGALGPMNSPARGWIDGHGATSTW